MADVIEFFGLLISHAFCNKTSESKVLLRWGSLAICVSLKVFDMKQFDNHWSASTKKLLALYLHFTYVANSKQIFCIQDRA